MLHVMRAGAVALALAAPLAASAGDVSASFRTGWAIPVGDIIDNVGLNDWFDGFVPLELEVDFRASERVRLGLYGSYGIASVVCGSSVDCSGQHYRVGAQLLVPLGEESAPFAGWLGVGAGFESARYEHTTTVYMGALYTERMTLNGWEASVQGGGAWALGSRWRAGPFLQLGVGRYEGGSVADYTDKAFHGWLQLGVRGSLGL